MTCTNWQKPMSAHAILLTGKGQHAAARSVGQHGHKVSTFRAAARSCTARYRGHRACGLAIQRASLCCRRGCACHKPVRWGAWSLGACLETLGARHGARRRYADCIYGPDGSSGKPERRRPRGRRRISVSSGGHARVEKQ